MSWKNLCSISAAKFIQEIVDQVPADGGARAIFEQLLDRLAEGVTPEVQAKLDKLEALEAAGVDNWEGYDEAMAELTDDDDDGSDDDDEED